MTTTQGETPLHRGAAAGQDAVRGAAAHGRLRRAATRRHKTLMALGLTGLLAVAPLCASHADARPQQDPWPQRAHATTRLLSRASQQERLYQRGDALRPVRAAHGGISHLPLPVAGAAREHHRTAAD